MTYKLYVSQNTKWVRTSHAGVKKILRLVTGGEGGGGGGGGGGDPEAPPETLVFRLYDNGILVHTENLHKNPEGLWYSTTGEYTGIDGLVYLCAFEAPWSDAVTGWGVQYIGATEMLFTHTSADTSTPYIGGYDDGGDNGTFTATVSLT